jgi:hypothetical protein
MYATIRRYQIKSEQVEAVTRKITEDFLPLISQVPGFVSYDVVAQGDRMWSVSVFETESGATESTRRAGEYVRQNLASVLPTPPATAQGEVTVHKAVARGIGPPATE